MGDWTDNPFAAGSGDSPFSDPSVTAAAPPPQQAEYNPFDAPPAAAAPRDNVASGAGAFGKQAAPAPVVTSQPAVDTSDVPDWATQGNSEKLTREAEQAKAAQAAQSSDPFAAERSQYDQREQQAAQQVIKDPNYRPPNFPPIPPKMQCGFFKPCFHLDIKGEIPDLGQKVVKRAFYSWEFLGFTYVWNFICTLAVLACDCDGRIRSIFLALAYMLIFGPCSYCCWFHQLYNGVRLDKSLKYGWFFFVMFFQIGFSAFAAIGVPGTGAAGIWIASDVIDGEKAAGILVFTGAILWILNVLLHLYVLRNSMKLYRSTGQSLEKAQSEAVYGATSAAANNPAIRQGLIDGATGAASSYS